MRYAVFTLLALITALPMKAYSQPDLVVEKYVDCYIGANYLLEEHYVSLGKKKGYDKNTSLLNVDGGFITISKLARDYCKEEFLKKNINMSDFQKKTSNDIIYFVLNKRIKTFFKNCQTDVCNEIHSRYLEEGYGI